MMWRRLLGIVLLCCAVVIVAPGAAQLGPTHAHAGPFTKVKKAKAQKEPGSRIDKLRRQAADGMRNLRPIRTLRKGAASLRRNFENFKRVKADKGLGNALGKSARKVAVETWMRVTPGGRRAARNKRVAVARGRAEDASRALQDAEGKLQLGVEEAQSRLQQMNDVIAELKLDGRSEALSADEISRIESAFGPFKRAELPTGKLSERAVHAKGNKKGQKQTQTHRQQLRRMLKYRMDAQARAVKSATQRAEKGAPKERLAMRRAALALSAERVRAGLSVGELSDGEIGGHALVSLSSSQPRNGRVRPEVRDQIALIDAFANADNPEKAAFLMEELDAVARPGSDKAREIFGAYGVDPSSAGGLSKQEARELQRVRGRVANKAVKQLAEQRENGIDATGVATALRGIKGQLRRRDVRMNLKIRNALNEHRKVLEARAKAIVQAADAEWRSADKRAKVEVKQISRQRRGRNRLSRAEKKKLKQQIILQNRAETLRSAEMAQDLVDQILALDLPLGGEAAANVTREDLLLGNKKTRGLQNDVTRIANRVEPLLRDRAMREQAMQQMQGPGDGADPVDDIGDDGANDMNVAAAN